MIDLLLKQCQGIAVRFQLQLVNSTGKNTCYNDLFDVLQTFYFNRYTPVSASSILSVYMKVIFHLIFVLGLMTQEYQKIKIFIIIYQILKLFSTRKLASDDKVIKDPLLAALAAREAANRNGKMTV